MSRRYSLLQDDRDNGFAAGDRVVVVGSHPWASYAGTIVGAWPTRDLDWLVTLDNGINVGADERHLRWVGA